jgi:hypothetical protein
LEYVLLDIDPSVLKGKIITAALLHVRSVSSEKAPLARVGVSSIASRWEEGTSKGMDLKSAVPVFRKRGTKS